MAGVPETRYADLGGVHFAYQVLEANGPDLLLIPCPNLPIDLLWDDPTVAGHLNRLASFSRLILTDLLGIGSSDSSPPGDPPMQSWTDGFVAVLDAAGSRRASVFASTESGLPAMLLAASHPRRVHSLILAGAYACFLRREDQTFGLRESDLARYLDVFGRNVGTGAVTEVLAPSWARDERKRRWWARCERLATGPGNFVTAFSQFARTDVRPVLGSIQAPTLVLRRRHDRHARGGLAEDIVRRIPDACFVELEGDDSIWLAGDADAVLDEVQTFLTGQRGAKPSNRVLSTILFTDIVGSTQRAAELGDDAWTAVLAAHDRTIAEHVGAWRGITVKFTGDGALATFDGPARAIECACAIRDAMSELELSIRVGLHTGEIEMAANDIHGIAVHVAARIMGLAEPDEVLVSGVMPPLVLGSRIVFDARGTHELKGVPDMWPVFAVR
jgi:class 3 adenylate cyclase